MKLALKSVLLTAALTVISAQSATVITCGQARPDLKVCLTSWSLPTGEYGSTFELRYLNDKSYPLENVVHSTDPSDATIAWHVGSGVVKGAWRQVWLRVDNRPLMLPVVPPAPSQAQIFYRDMPNQPWSQFPNTDVFPMNAPIN